MFPICNHNPWPWIIPHGLVRNHRRDSRKIHPRCHQYVQSIPRFTCLPSIRCSWTARTTPHHTATKKNIHKVNKPRMIQLIKSCSCQLSSTFIKASICLKHFTLSLSFFQHLWRFLTQASWPLRWKVMTGNKSTSEQPMDEGFKMLKIAIAYVCHVHDMLYILLLHAYYLFCIHNYSIYVNQVLKQAMRPWPFCPRPEKCLVPKGNPGRYNAWVNQMK